MKKLLLVIALLLLPATVCSQGAPSNITPVLGPTGAPKAGATVSFCLHPANAVPCTNYASAFSDIALTLSVNQTTNPLKTDGLGNAPTFFASPGIYDYTVSGVGIAAPQGPYVIAIYVPGQAFVCTQTIAALTWTCNHNLNNLNVIVQAFDTTSKVIVPDGIVRTNANTVTITFISPQAGSAVMMNVGSVSTTFANTIVSNPLIPQMITGQSLTLTSTAPLIVQGTLQIPTKADPASPLVGEFWVNLSAAKFRDNAGTPATHQLAGLDQANAFSGANTHSGTETFTGAANLNAGGALVGTFSGNHTETGTVTNTGQILCKNFENIRCADQFAGATVDVQITNATADLPATGGTVDARGYGATTQTIAAQLQIGSATKPVTLLVDRATVFNISVTGGVDAIQLFNGSCIIAPGTGQKLGGTGGGFFLTSSANVSSLLANSPQDGTQQYACVQGVTLGGNSAATVTTALVNIVGIFQNSFFRDVVVQNFFQIGLRISNPTAGNTSDLLFDNVWLNGNANAGARPLVITAAGTGTIQNIRFKGGAIEHAGASQILAELNGTAGSCESMSFDHTGFETSATPLEVLKVTDCSNVVVDGMHVTGPTGTNLITLAQVTAPRLNNIHLRNIRSLSGWTTTINDTFTPRTIVGAVLGGVASISEYVFRGPVDFPNVLVGGGTALAKYSRFAVSLSPAAVAANTCAAQSFTVTGIAAADILIAVSKPTEQAGLAVTPGHVTALNTATINFCNVTAAAITPTAAETYQFVAVQ